jgi:hypothetical protein
MAREVKLIKSAPTKRSVTLEKNTVFQDSIKANKLKEERYWRKFGYAVNLAAFEPNTPCPVCGTIVEELRNVQIRTYFDSRRKKGEANPWVCGICCQRITDPPRGCEPPKPKRPRGWQFMAVFVDKDGTVFHKGEEQVELKGTLEPTNIEDKPKEEVERKLSKVEKTNLKHDALLLLNDLKSKIKKGVDEKGKPLTKAAAKELDKAFKKQEKIINKLN